MAHHGSEIPNDLMKNLDKSDMKEKLFDLEQKLDVPFKDRFHNKEDIGATGKFPEGKLNKTDEGEIRFAVAIENNKVVLYFGKPVAWLGCTKQQAMDIAKTIINKAQTLI